MSDLSDFLLARIAEDEEITRAAVNAAGEWVVTNPIGGDPSCGQGIAEPMNVARVFQNAQGRPWVMEWEVLSAERGDSLEILFETAPDAADVSRELAHIARWDPARVLAECKAKRQVIGLLDGYTDRDVEYWALHEALELLALPYADHPDYRSEWRP